MTTARQYPHAVLSLSVLILFLFQSLSGPSQWVPSFLGSSGQQQALRAPRVSWI